MTTLTHPLPDDIDDDLIFASLNDLVNTTGTNSDDNNIFDDSAMLALLDDPTMTNSKLTPIHFKYLMESLGDEAELDELQTTVQPTHHHNHNNINIINKSTLTTNQQMGLVNHKLLDRLFMMDDTFSDGETVTASDSDQNPNDVLSTGSSPHPFMNMGKTSSSHSAASYSTTTSSSTPSTPLSTTTTTTQQQQQQPLTVLANLVPRAKYAIDYLHPIALPNEFNMNYINTENVLVTVQFDTVFCKKYYRFDTKILQCFPRCDKFQDVREARLLGLEHGISETRKNGGAWCSSNIQSTMYVDGTTLKPNEVFVRGRIVMAVVDASSTSPPSPTTNTASSEMIYPVGTHVMNIPNELNLIGIVNPLIHGGFPIMDQLGRVGYSIIMTPQHTSGWKHEVELPRHRRNIGQKGARVSVPLFTFEITVFRQLPGGTSGYVVVARSLSSLFEIGSVRTLLREAFVFKQTQGLVVSGQRVVDPSESLGTMMNNPKGHISSSNPNKKSKAVRRFQRQSSGGGDGAIISSSSSNNTSTTVAAAVPTVVAGSNNNATTVTRKGSGENPNISTPGTTPSTSSSSLDNVVPEKRKSMSLLERFLKLAIGGE
jgi:hypothetical protein